MSATIQANQDNSGDMPAEIDFGNATRGKFYYPASNMKLPLFLEPTVLAALSDIAECKGQRVSDLINELLKNAMAFQRQ